MRILLALLPHAVDQTPAPASWWQIAPWLALGLLAIAVGLLLSRKGPS